MFNEGINDLTYRIGLDIQAGPSGAKFKERANLNLEIGEALTDIYNHVSGATPERREMIAAVKETEAFKNRDSYPDMHDNFPNG